MSENPKIYSPNFFLHRRNFLISSSVVMGCSIAGIPHNSTDTTVPEDPDTSENIEDTDVFLALTNNDEANIMSSLLAKRMGAGKVMTLIANPAYVDLIQSGEIDIAISPQQATLSSLLRHTKKYLLK